MTRNGDSHEHMRTARSNDSRRSWEGFQSLPIGVVLSGPSGDVLSCNRAAFELLGVTEDQLIGNARAGSPWNCLREDGPPAPV
jgi:PAS domain-containing protein